MEAKQLSLCNGKPDSSLSLWGLVGIGGACAIYFIEGLHDSGFQLLLLFCLNKHNIDINVYRQRTEMAATIQCNQRLFFTSLLYILNKEN